MSGPQPPLPPPPSPPRAARRRWRSFVTVIAILLPLTLLAGFAPGCRHRVDHARTPAASSAGGPLILISLDGWRWDYDKKAPTPNLQRLIARGVRAEGLVPTFPSKTFPNHYSVVTGLYPAHHGIVANTIYDPQTELRFSLSDRASVGDARWWGGEPIWNTVQRQGKRAATLFWPGSEAPIGGMRPAYWKLYDGKLANDARVDQVLAWLDLPAGERPVFITCYFSDTDTAGHDDGPDSPALREAVVRLDAILGRLLDGLQARGLDERVNVVVTSDHGMAATSPDRAIVIDDYVDAATSDIIDVNPTVGVVPRTVPVDQVYARLKSAHPRLRVYRREETPAHWRYRDNPRIPPIVGVADEGWVVVRQRAGQPRPTVRAGGAHGYDPQAQSMHGLFVAAGPAFRRGVTVPAFENVHLYNALAAALAVQPAPNDGDPAVARTLLAAQ
jgi:predicted AlkP superfamily pyrophosphatase or phosphodiesterase